VNQIGVAKELVNTLFMGFVGALALGLGLGIGLGGRDTFAQIISSWYRRSQQAAPKLSQAASAAREEATEMGEEVSGRAGNGRARAR
jgi:hypothetical protein